MAFYYIYEIFWEGKAGLMEYKNFQDLQIKS